MKHKKIEQFQMEIRRRQKDDLMRKYRKKCLTDPHQGQQSTKFYHHLVQQWRDFVDDDKSSIPYLFCLKLSQIQPTVGELDRVINKIDPSKPLNILFVAHIAIKYSFISESFLQKSLECVPHICQLTQHQTMKITQFSQLKSIQQIHIFLWCAYLKYSETTKQFNIKNIAYHFFRWWNNEALTLQYRICSRLCSCLLTFKDSAIIQQIKNISTGLMQDASQDTYKLISQLICLKQNKDIKVLLLLSENFEDFLLNGSHQVILLPSTLRILNEVMQCYNYYQHIENISSQLIGNIYQVYIEQNKILTTRLQSNILNTFYNMLVSQLPGTFDKLSSLDYEQFFKKTSLKNMLGFIDLAIVLLSKNHRKEIYQKFLIKTKLSDIMMNMLQDGNLENRLSFLQTIANFIQQLQTAIQENIFSGVALTMVFDISKWLANQKKWNIFQNSQEEQCLKNIIDTCDQILNDTNEDFS